ncbi:hypothetical protein D1007_45235 [Hordeum vulgare]|nr:hypothetical protein D1007_45235 [Hordeum vulgare]
MSHNVNEGGQPTTGDVLHTIGTQTQEKKNRKKRACLRETEDTRLKKIKAKLSVPKDKFVATNCLREFNNAYQDGSLKSKDMINIFDSDKKLQNDEVYELSNNLVTNFTTLAAHAKAFTKLDFMKFTCFNPPDCPQQKTQ